MTTSECVHLVTRGHFRSRDKDGGYTIRSAVAENPMLHANFVTLCSTEPKLLPIEDWHCGNRTVRPVWRLWAWPWPDDLIRTLPVFPGDVPDGRIWTYYVKAIKSCRLTDRHLENYIPRRFVGGRMWHDWYCTVYTDTTEVKKGP